MPYGLLDGTGRPRTRACGSKFLLNPLVNRPKQCHAIACVRVGRSRYDVLIRAETPAIRAGTWGTCSAISAWLHAMASEISIEDRAKRAAAERLARGDLVMLEEVCRDF